MNLGHRKKSDVNINGYKCFNFYRKFQNRRANRCSGGIVIYVKDIISDGIKIVRNHFDSVIWLKLDRNFFNIESDVYIAGVYVWGENSPAYNFADVDFFSVLQDDINDNQSQGRVVLCGDWNARVGNGSRPDFIPCDRVVENTDSDNYLPDSLSLRRSQDNVCNSHGLKLLDLCKSTSLRIANGRLGSDNGIGTFTYASRTGCSVIDYVILGQSDFCCMNDFKIHPFCEWSDHTPLSYNIVCNNDHFITKGPQYRTRIKWNDSLRNDLRRNLVARLTDLNTAVSQIDISDRHSIDSCIEKFSTRSCFPII